MKTLSKPAPDMIWTYHFGETAGGDDVAGMNETVEEACRSLDGFADILVQRLVVCKVTRFSQGLLD